MFDFAYKHESISILLLDGFSTLSLGSVAEPLHFFAERYPDIAPSIELLSAGGDDAVSSGGVRVECDLQLADYLEQLSIPKGKRILVICGPTEKASLDAEALLPVLRKARFNQIPVFGIGSVCLLMAHAGMFDGEKCAVHWKLLASFVENNWNAEGVNSLFVKRSSLGSCAGETAVLDLVISLIADISKEASVAAANHFLINAPRFGDVEQPGSQTRRLLGAPKYLAQAVETMARNIEETLSLSEIARQSCVSSRQMERLFRNHLGTSPGNYYRAIRLERALDLLTNTTMSLAEIALASGFSNTSCLSKHFKTRYGETPVQRRKRKTDNEFSWPLVVA